MKGAMVLVSPTLQDVMDRMSQAAEVSLPVPRQTEREHEVAQPLDSGGMVKDEESGGAEGGMGLSRDEARGQSAREWKCLAVEEANKNQVLGDPLYGLQSDMLTGQGPYATTNVQLIYPIEMHQLSQWLAHRVLLLVPDKKKPAPYSTIKQGVTEPYGQFIDRLSAALKDAPDVSPEVQEHLFRSLAFENANSRTRTILAMLPQGSPVDEMLVRATRAEQNNQTVVFTAAMHDAMQQQGHIIADALSGGKINNPSHSNKTLRTNKPAGIICFRCGETGHFKQACQRTVWCHKYNLDTHATEACRKLGNIKRSALKHRAKTQINALTQKTLKTASW
ncbi:hypothetical protein HGM15179_018316 [Zosterops borbonicus]|uniref:CCHC-type domain-containing protein n=1 Tax=Zosterops borbonicus TaxID=364589 RepID=A0A8K1FZ87_9PASS|nr:hypothetical protein HGM15179_018316 [Zosterops borbonicus]